MNKCLNCGHEQELNNNNVFMDELGNYTVCEKCESSYDVIIGSAENE